MIEILVLLAGGFVFGLFTGCAFVMILLAFFSRRRIK